MTRFVEHFWDTEFNSTNGYDVLLKRMKEGREMCKDYEEFLKQRAKAEEVFGKTLVKIAKSSGGKDEIGTLKTSWDEVVSQTENCGQSHINISIRLIEEAKKVEEFREAQKEKRRKEEDGIKRLITAKRDQHNKVMHSKRTYECKCKEADIADDAYMKGRLVGPTKDQDKLLIKKDKLRQASTQADAQYQKEVVTLEQTRQEWEDRMTQLCVIFQQLEMERIRFLRNTMWVFSNIISLQCCSDDENSDDMRKALSDCNEDKDIQLFISQKATGSLKPAQVVYECYYKDGSMAAKSSGGSGGGISNGRSRQTLPPIPAAMKIDQHRALPPPPEISSPTKEDGIYSSMSDYSTGVIGQIKAKDSNKFMAKFDYEAQGDEELDIKAGDILIIVNRDDDTWWYAEINGKRGHVPADYLGPCANTGDEGHTTYL
ncbi:proline-serine-threonine phosphatase-interacting protein 1-like [Asterias amurensis]|uniref:proline-serine-threonine phosphatase-interacting protein 1-like n=1 Tax=Asterias amurensis TaxID=7602 RepID=UPI003AB41E85